MEITMDKKVTLCAFADEASPDLDEQIVALRENHISLLEMRGVDGVNILGLTDAQARRAREKLDAAGISVWSLGSPLGKTPITDDFAAEREHCKRLLHLAHLTGARCLRLFSFYGTDGSKACRDEVMARLSCFAELARDSGVVLCHENEKGIYGDNAERCLDIARSVPAIKAVFDPANFVQCGQDVLPAFEMLAPYVHYGHIKDAIRAGGRVVPPGDGEGCLKAYLPRFFADGHTVLTLEPHLASFVGLTDLEGPGGTSAVGHWHFADNRAAFDFAVDRFKTLLGEIGQ